MRNDDLSFQTGGRRKENEEGLHWDNPDNPYNGTDDEDGGDRYESYYEGFYHEDDEYDDSNDEDN
ncbi:MULTISPECIES: hypothetical protein [Croceibacter]|uniref:hypothetical protein n=1 Tax=Croceibacter TaxID=216431 RepID=UPI000C520F67|nr:MULTISPECIES: hypothetical protein [Croceibacter]MBG25780.1 hypothetical protein [Croceibacter sp.]|tara:strand:+ start:300 stop:494 length:195 start_codon:yes stop_codon:yes gene_type:complete